MKRSFDLHTHSTDSDGKLDKERLIMKAQQENFEALSITDHNIITLKGLKKILEGMSDNKVSIIPGIEIDCNLPRRLHLLGYYMQNDEKINNFLVAVKKENAEKTLELIDILHKIYHLDITVQEVKKYSTEYLNKRAVISAMIDKGLVDSAYEANGRYLGEHLPNYVPMKKVTAKEGIQLILDSGGIPVLAHPITIFKKNTEKEFEPLLRELIDYGLMGIEIINFRESFDYRNYFEKLAKKYKLITTAGTDFHNYEKDKLGIFENPEQFLYPLMEIGSRHNVK